MKLIYLCILFLCNSFGSLILLDNPLDKMNHLKELILYSKMKSSVIEEERYTFTVYSHSEGFVVEHYNKTQSFDDYEYFYQLFYSSESELIGYWKYINIFTNDCMSEDVHIIMKYSLPQNILLEESILDESGKVYKKENCLDKFEYLESMDTVILKCKETLQNSFD
ncbi:hypothetical protein MY04_3914 [Flammeovirga sp. MY04]|uniref:hypothetical protein n=1 Tax=Flammeovirga sp. MY04 TaxID=1191459 RepID=UPI0008061ADB|nr:hypothetical protein [Flammeovirga sp. MY04]ANQ51258.1 hypothetical protein MY04_3914 [Flammeovirga sp. MY04]